MKKKIASGYWYYNIGSFIGMLSGIGVGGLACTAAIITPIEVNPSVVVLYYTMPVWLFITFGLPWMLGAWGIRFFVFTEEGIEARSLWGTIRKVKWEDVKEIRSVRLYVSVQGAFTAGWFFIDDGIERIAHHSGLMDKTTDMTIPANKHNRKIIEMFWKNGIVDVVEKI